MKTALLLAATCALAACSGSKEPDAARSTDPALSPVASPEPGASAEATSADAATAITAIPAAMQGRWGLVPADCTTTNGDDKGLVTIGAESMKFYESVARLKTITQGTGGAVKATFAYSGEGMDWTRDTTLAVRDGGKALVFEEFGEDAPKGARIYTRCPG